MQLDTYTNTIVQTLANGSGLLGAAVWKSVVILALITMVMLAWRRGAAAIRHLVWTTALFCLLFLPLFVWWLPGWRAPSWMTSSGMSAGLPTSLEFVLGKRTGAEAAAAAETAQPTGTGNQETPWAPQPALSAEKPHMVWRGVMVAVWLAGVAFGFARLLAAWMQLRRLARAARACENPDWLRLADALRAEYRLGRKARLLIAHSFVTPMTWGLRRPVVVLPAESANWPVDRLRVVLRHELAHVKRWDCLTQEIAHVVCTLYWLNPLTWLAARQMRSARELACDDTVLNAGARPSDYATHLVEIAGRLAHAPRLAAVPMVRPTGLKLRVSAILDTRRRRSGMTAITALPIVLAVFSLGLLVGSIRLEAADNSPRQPWSLQRSAVAGQLKQFVAEKEAQANAALKAEGQEMLTEYKAMLAAAEEGNWQTISNVWQELRSRAPQYAGSGRPDPRLTGIAWQTVLETWGAFEAFGEGEEKYSIAFGRDIISSIPPGSIYFGGTDPGRFIVTALSKSHVNADPFFTLTQNALADRSYVDYLRSMYGSRMVLPTDQDSQRCFQEYVEDVRRRQQENKLKPDEHVTVTPDGRVSVTGVGGVMAINGLMVKSIFEKNPDREFYIEESYRLDWMYPHLEPHGLIFKINRQPLAALSDETVRRDREYWTRCIQPMIGDWVTENTPVQQIAAFAEKVYLNHDFTGFKGDARFVQNVYSHQTFSKLRASIAGLYAWRMDHSSSEPEKTRMAHEADFTFRQALALCPYSPEAVMRYGDFLKAQKRIPDALLVAETAERMPPMQGKDGDKLRELIKQLKQSEKTE